jgi:flavin reductase (DIM6/NTAB) family NADH-FMN oxidoreductase RutF
LTQTLRAWTRPLPQWSPIGLPDPGECGSLVRVTLKSHGLERDVTDNHAVVSLDPLLLAVGGREIASAADARLDFSDRASGALLGWLELDAAPSPFAGPGPRVYAVRAGGHRCVDWPTRAWQRLLQPPRARVTGFRMSAAAQRHLAIVYLLPRPVFYVSVDDGDGSNLFPMDLIGTVGAGLSLALRRTSPSVTTMRRSLRVALGDVAVGDRALAYGLGEHHREARIDWARLPVPMVDSEKFGLRLPVCSLRIRECRIEQVADMGSHCWFLCRVVSEHLLGTGPRLCHTSGIHSHYRARIRQAPWTAAGDAA